MINEIKDINVSGIVLNDRDFHCIARLFQSTFYAPESNYFYACSYCKYCFECCVDSEGENTDLSDFNMIRLMRKFGKITGVDTGALSTVRRFYAMSIQELFPEKAKKLVKISSTKSLKRFEKLEKKYVNEIRKSTNKLGRLHKLERLKIKIKNYFVLIIKNNNL